MGTNSVVFSPLHFFFSHSFLTTSACAVLSVSGDTPEFHPQCLSLPKYQTQAAPVLIPGRPGCPAAPGTWGEHWCTPAIWHWYPQAHCAHQVSSHKHLHDLTSRAPRTLLAFPITIFTIWLHIYIEREKPCKTLQRSESFRTRIRHGRKHLKLSYAHRNVYTFSNLFTSPLLFWRGKEKSYMTVSIVFPWSLTSASLLFLLTDCKIL